MWFYLYMFLFIYLIKRILNNNGNGATTPTAPNFVGERERGIIIIIIVYCLKEEINNNNSAGATAPNIQFLKEREYLKVVVYSHVKQQ